MWTSVALRGMTLHVRSKNHKWRTRKTSAQQKHSLGKHGSLPHVVRILKIFHLVGMSWKAEDTFLVQSSMGSDKIDAILHDYGRLAPRRTTACAGRSGASGGGIQTAIISHCFVQPLPKDAWKTRRSSKLLIYSTSLSVSTTMESKTHVIRPGNYGCKHST